MIDYFALLDQPRRPWLDPETLKQAFHEKTLRAHPDAQSSQPGAAAAESNFAEINDAYHTLQDPKLRLQHLLALENQAPQSRFDSVPAAVADLFPTIAEATQAATRLADKAAGTTSTLARSLLTAEVVQMRTRLATLLETLTHLHDEADAELREISANFPDAGNSVRALQQLYVRYSYLRRWISQLEEHQTAFAAM